MREIRITEKELLFLQAGIRTGVRTWDKHIGNVSYGEGIYFTTDEIKEIMKKFDVKEEIIDWNNN
ncbi:hypothetical protein LCGC14_0495310 [marine sediment metagenome]|uniref:Uncharacterized protein n=1 Tax=marine sediment metagenome TaxID=412755 RepID=A0A0F9SAM8_9ZZZZ|nr:hypothetical protein [bacterium]